MKPNRLSEGPFELLAGAVREVMRYEMDAGKRLEAERALGVLARLTAIERVRDAEAVTAQSDQAVLQATELVERSAQAQ